MCLSPLFAAELPPALARLRAEVDRLGRQAAARFAPQHYPAPPAWATRPDPPLATLAVLADPHSDVSGRLDWAKPTRDRLLRVCRFLNDSIRPDLVLLLGDLIANGDDPAQLRHVKALLEEHLKAPYLPVHGNHDGPAFESVFGPANRVRDLAGLRLLTLGLTFWHWDSGYGRYDRLDWLAAQLKDGPTQPTLILTHNPVWMPTFANNADVLRLLDAQPQVLAVLAGHMHADYEVPLAKTHIGVPMLIRPPYAFKVIRLHPDRLLLFTYEDPDGTYRQADIYQKLDLPPACRLGPAAKKPRDREPPMNTDEHR